MKRYSQRGMYNAVADINIVPLMDLVFNLLIVFMLATPLLEQSANIALPPLKGAAPLNKKDITTVNLDSSGHLFLDKKRVTLPELEKAVHAKVLQDKEHAVVVRGDKNVDYGKFVEIVDRLKLAGVTKLGIMGTSQ